MKPAVDMVFAHLIENEQGDDPVVPSSVVTGWPVYRHTIMPQPAQALFLLEAGGNKYFTMDRMAYALHNSIFQVVARAATNDVAHTKLESICDFLNEQNARQVFNEDSTHSVRYGPFIQTGEVVPLEMLDSKGRFSWLVTYRVVRQRIS